MHILVCMLCTWDMDAPIIYPGMVKFGMALGLGPRNRGFESLYSDHFIVLLAQLDRATAF